MKTYTVTGGGGLKLHVQETGNPKKPMLLSYGEQDVLVLPAMRKHMAELAKNATLSVYPDVGHAPFWEAPERFNRELREFRKSV